MRNKHLLKAEVLLSLKTFAKKYHEEATQFKTWFDKTMLIRKQYAELINMHNDQLDYLQYIFDNLYTENIRFPISLKRFSHGPENEVLINNDYLEKRHATEENINREISFEREDVKACEYLHKRYSKIINDAMIENRNREKIAYKADYAIDLLERGFESIELNNSKNYAYHSHFQIPSEGVLGDRKFAFESVHFSKEEIEEFLSGYFDYTIPGGTNKNGNPHSVQRERELLHIKIKNMVNKESAYKVNKLKKKKDIMYLVADKLGKSFEAVKWNYYYKAKS